MKKIIWLSLISILSLTVFTAAPVLAGPPEHSNAGGLLSDLQDAIDEVKETLVKVSTDLQEQIDEIDNTVNQLADDIYAIVQGLADNMTAVEGQIASINAELSGLQQQIENEAAARIATDDSLQSQIDDIEMPMLGAWQSRSLNTTYQADMDGFVVAWSNTGQLGYTYLILRADSSDSPTTVRAMTHEPDLGGVSITVPVPQDDYWKVQGNGMGDWAVYWLPFGN